MVRKELVIGFVVAGFLSVHVPTLVESHLRDGHGAWTVLENVCSRRSSRPCAFVCSVGNVPLAAALWGHGVAFGGVIAFIFADLVTLPLLAIYRRFYGPGATARLLVMLWGTASLAGLAVDGLFRLTSAAPRNHHVAVLSGHFPLGATLVLNVLATLVLVLSWRLARSASSGRLATDPVCGMSVETSSAAATIERGTSTLYFCSPRCREHFLAELPAESTSSFIDPVCGMSVTPDGNNTPVEREGVAYYFCSEGCRRIFIEAASPSEPFE